jgi:hypothetical protein
VALVLNLRTANVSPQFHIKFDDLFEKAMEIKGSYINWQVEAHFTKKETAKQSLEYISAGPTNQQPQLEGGKSKNYQDDHNCRDDDEVSESFPIPFEQTDNHNTKNYQYQERTSITINTPEGEKGNKDADQIPR